MKLGLADELAVVTSNTQNPIARLPAATVSDSTASLHAESKASELVGANTLTRSKRHNRAVCRRRKPYQHPNRNRKLVPAHSRSCRMWTTNDGKRAKGGRVVKYTAKDR